ncbi:MAG: hypothetical protein WDO72_01955 [Pseudomonadota bacterium]
MFDLVGKYFWALCIGVTALNFYVLAPRNGAPGTDDLEDIAELQTMRHRVFGLAILPWLVMGISQVVGDVPNVWSFFRPQDLDPYVWSWYVSIFLLSCAFAYWVYFRGGARLAIALKLIQVSGFRGQVTVNEKWVKIFAALGPPFTIFWVWLAWTMDTPVVK